MFGTVYLCDGSMHLPTYCFKSFCLGEYLRRACGVVNIHNVWQIRWRERLRTRNNWNLFVPMCLFRACPYDHIITFHFFLSSPYDSRTSDVSWFRIMCVILRLVRRIGNMRVALLVHYYSIHTSISPGCSRYSASFGYTRWCAQRPKICQAQTKFTWLWESVCT